MKNKTSCKSGFTLIELLVVVLIIGILAAIALPQYQKAVEKSKATQALSLLKTFVQAQNAYFMANGSYAARFEDLAVEMPWTGTDKWKTTNVDTRSNAEWSLQLYQSAEHGNAVYVGRISGPYKGGGFVYFFDSPQQYTTSQLLCAERRSSGVVYAGSAGSYCQKIFGGMAPVNSPGLRMYTLP